MVVGHCVHLIEEQPKTPVFPSRSTGAMSAIPAPPMFFDFMLPPFFRASKTDSAPQRKVAAYRWWFHRLERLSRTPRLNFLFLRDAIRCLSLKRPQRNAPSSKIFAMIAQPKESINNVVLT